jgi:hypothetical protein
MNINLSSIRAEEEWHIECLVIDNRVRVVDAGQNGLNLPSARTDLSVEVSRYFPCKWTCNYLVTRRPYIPYTSVSTVPPSFHTRLLHLLDTGRVQLDPYPYSAAFSTAGARGCEP